MNTDTKQPEFAVNRIPVCPIDPAELSQCDSCQ